METSRREFLHFSAAVAASMLAKSPLLRAAEPPVQSTGMKLGLVTYQWGKDWDVPTLIKHCAAAHFTGVELRTGHQHGVESTLTPAERAEVRKQFADSPVAVVGIGSACDYHAKDPAAVRKNIDETKEFIRLSHDIGGTGVKVRPNGLHKDVPVEQTIEQIGKSLNEVAAYAADYGQEIRLEVHGRETSEIPIIHQIMQIGDHPFSRICWNCNKSDLNGAGLKANFELLQSRIATVHIHDLTINDYPWEELFGLLKGMDFQGWTLLEEGRIPQDLPQAMLENWKVWKQLTAR